MKRAPKAMGRRTVLGAALAVMVAGTAFPIAVLVGPTAAGADTPSYTMACTSVVAGTTLLPGATTGTISTKPVSPGGSFTISNYGFHLSLASSAGALSGIAVGATLTTSVSVTGASPPTQSTTITFPPMVVSPGNSTLSGTGDAGTFTADATGANQVTVSPGAAGTLTLDLGAPVNLSEVASCVVTDAGGTPITPPVLDAAPIAVPAGQVSAVLPNAGPTSGGTVVVIHGSYLAGPTQVLFGSTPALSVQPLTDDSIAAVAPPGSVGTVDVAVITAAGQSTLTPGDRFTYTDGPIVTGVSPPTGAPAGGTTVVLTGSGFAGATAVDFGGSTAAFTVDSATTITATSPGGTGAVDVTVTGPSGTSVVSSQDRFAYRAGYWLVGADGGVFSYGNAPFTGSAGNVALNSPVVGMASTPDRGGYWLVGGDGGVFTYGDAGFFGSAGGTALRAPVVGIVATPDGFGYWLVAADGGVFTYGDARYFGSAGGETLDAPVSGMAVTPDGGGYWLVGDDGGVFAYGDARFLGSAGGRDLSAPVVGIATTASGGGYWLVASNGAVITYGDAAYDGSAGGIRLSGPAVGIGTPGGESAYLLAGGDGGVFAYGGATFSGSAGGEVLNAPIVGIAVA